MMIMKEVALILTTIFYSTGIITKYLHWMPTGTQVNQVNINMYGNANIASGFVGYRWHFLGSRQE